MVKYKLFYGTGRRKKIHLWILNLEVCTMFTATIPSPHILRSKCYLLEVYEPKLNPKWTSYPRACHGPGEVKLDLSFWPITRAGEVLIQWSRYMKGVVCMMCHWAIESAGFGKLPRTVWHQQSTYKEGERWPDCEPATPPHSPQPRTRNRSA
jgi:hypothetical protein